MAERITQKTIKNLTPPKHGNRILYDREIPGFGVRITSAGAVSFILNYRFAGRERRYTIGRYPELTAIAARERAMQLRVGILDGHDPLEEREQTRTQPTVNELASEYLERYAVAHKRPHSLRDDRQMLTSIIQPHLGTLRVQAVTRRDLEALHASLKGTPYLGNRTLALLSKMFSLAGEWGWCTDNPRGIHRFHESRRERWLQPEELQRFVEALDGYPNQNVADCFRLLLLTGSRKTEVLTAEWPMFDLQRGLWVKPSSHTKEKKTEHIPLSAAALQLLNKMKEQNGAERFLFPGLTGKPRTTLRQAWFTICKTAGLSGVRVHDLRHSYASYLVSSGVSLPVVGKLLGHTQPQTTARYSHLSNQSLRDASNLFGEIFQTAGKANGH